MDRKDLMQKKLDSFLGIRLQEICFNSKTVPYIPYWYDDDKRCLTTKEGVSVPFCFEPENLDINDFDRAKMVLEVKLIEFYKKERNINLSSYYDLD